VVGHGLEFKQVGIFVGFLGFRREGEEQMQGKKYFFFLCLVLSGEEEDL
jgi:hypothetical protein